MQAHLPPVSDALATQLADQAEVQAAVARALRARREAEIMTRLGQGTVPVANPFARAFVAGMVADGDAPLPDVVALVLAHEDEAAIVDRAAQRLRELPADLARRVATFLDLLADRCLDVAPPEEATRRQALDPNIPAFLRRQAV